MYLLSGLRLGELTALFQTPLVRGEGPRCPSTRTLTPLSAFGLEFRPFGP